MEKQKLPNGVAALILGIVGFLCCCLAGLGAIPAAIGFYLARKSEKIYLENPDDYSDYGQIRTAKIIALVVLIINILYMARVVYVIGTLGWDEFWNQVREAQEQMGFPTQ